MKKSVIFSITLALLSTVACAAPSDDAEDGLDEESGETSSAILGLGGSKAAPSCVVKTVDDFSWSKQKQTVTIENNCKANLKLGLDLDVKADPECYVVPGNGGTSTWTFKTKVSVTKVKACK